ncbi:MAG: 30S ribosomal protein S18, partial [Planctomycetota bacterium]|nr:30S ribosomal protein S18 [Planctomycetota bacterium]
PPPFSIYQGLGAACLEWKAPDRYTAPFVAPDMTGGCRKVGIQDDRRFHVYGRKQRRGNFLKTGIKECVWVDYKSVDELRRLMTPNGKIYSRKRLSTSASEQRKVAKAIKRARHMGLLPYTSGTL